MACMSGRLLFYPYSILNVSSMYYVHYVCISDHPLISTISTYLSVCEVVLAESLPQQSVLSEGPQLGAHLPQADQVPAIRQTLHDVELQADRQVNQSHSCGSRLEETGGRKSHE